MANVDKFLFYICKYTAEQLRKDQVFTIKLSRKGRKAASAPSADFPLSLEHAMLLSEQERETGKKGEKL